MLLLKLFEESFIWLLTHEMAVTVVTKAIKSRWTLQNFNSCFVLNFIRKTQNYKFMLLWNMRKLPFPSNVLNSTLKKYAISLISYLPHLWFGAWLKTRIQFTVRYPNLILYDPTYILTLSFCKWTILKWSKTIFLSRKTFLILSNFSVLFFFKGQILKFLVS